MWNPFSLFRSSSDNLLSTSDKQLLVQAIQAAEQKTSGEIRVFIESKLSKSDPIRSAEAIFLKNKMHATKDKNGVLIYIAVKDKKLAILGDEGIHNKVGTEFWQKEVAEMVNEFKAAHYVDGIVKVIHEIGNALTTHFPYDRSADKNELSDEIMIGK